jgi:hypothetical protein
MVSEPGQRRVRDREVETLEKILELAHFVATDTFDTEVDTAVELTIQDYDTKRIAFADDTQTEAPA